MTTRTAGVIRTVVVDDQPLLVNVLSALVAVQPDMEMVLEAINRRQAVEGLITRATGLHGGAGLVLMNLRTSVLNGISTTRKLRVISAAAALRVLALTIFDDEDLALAALDAGAHGFLLKDAKPTTLLEAIRVVTDEGSWPDPTVIGTVLACLDADTGPGVPPSSASPPASPSASTDGAVPVVGVPSGPCEVLTGREGAILVLVCQGLSNASIGERLRVAEPTVKSRVKMILGKTGCHNRIKLVTYVLTTGFVQLRQLSSPGRRRECRSGCGLYPW